MAENDEFFLAVEFHRQDRGVELFLAQRKEDRVVFKLDRGGGVLAAVNDARELVSAAQTAARTRTLRLTRSGDNVHKSFSKNKIPGTRPSTRSKGFGNPLKITFQ